MYRGLRIVVISAVFLFFSSFLHLFAADISAKGKILFLEGDVKVMLSGSAQWSPAVKGMGLSDDDSIKTGAHSWAEIGTGKNYRNIAKVKENTVVKFINLGPVKISLLKGEVRSLVEKLSGGSAFEIETPTAVCGARGTGWDTYTDGKKVIADVYENEVYFNPLSENASDPIIKAGKRGVMIDPAKPVKIKDIPLKKIENWNKWRKDFSQRRGAPQREKIREKVHKTQKTQKFAESAIKNKEALLNKKDKDSINTRTGDNNSNGNSCGTGSP